MTHWGIQSNLVKKDDVEAMLAAARHCGSTHQTFEAIPFSDQIPTVDGDRPTVLYGSTNIMRAAAESGKWSPGVFSGAFTCRDYDDHYGGSYFNHPCEVMTLRQIAMSRRDPDATVFLRPNDDHKGFAGGVLAF